MDLPEPSPPTEVDMIEPPDPGRLHFNRWLRGSVTRATPAYSETSTESCMRAPRYLLLPLVAVASGGAAGARSAELFLYGLSH